MSQRTWRPGKHCKRSGHGSQLLLIADVLLRADSEPAIQQDAAQRAGWMPALITERVRPVHGDWADSERVGWNDSSVAEGNAEAVTGVEPGVAACNIAIPELEFLDGA